MLQARRLALALALTLIAIAACESIANAEPAKGSGERRQFGLAWVRGRGAEACAPPSVLVRGVRERLGYDPFALEASNTIEVLIRRDNDVYASEIVVRAAEDEGDPSSRTITSRAPDCGPLVEALVLAVAVIIDPDAALEEHPIAPPIAKPPSEPSRPPAPKRLPVAALPASDPTWSTWTTLRAAVATGLAPHPAPGIVLAVKVVFRRSYALEIGTLWVTETSGNDPAYRFGTTLGWLGGCRVLGLGQSVFLDACAELWAGATHAVVFGRAPFEPGQRWLGALAATPRLAWLPFPHVVVEGGANVLVSWLKNEFRVVGQAEPIYSQPLVSVIGFVGAGIVF